MKPLKGKIALVTGGSRGAGRAIAVELGKAGATVYMTGRSIRGLPRINGPVQLMTPCHKLKLPAERVLL
ncbi:SDR family NAD(P)-dependent oxidoreductase [Bacillus paralicheniformis]|nr:SDR family NAD(P)-dependent oxidoreductase [Bacillus paralicheniformis]USO20081.1 SDR family NAD(P)-dependent oxidoreductase [Bacillus paralicheniformis]WHH53698.1 SDR family NAD(P)-dependent oxidoreductase [Bacillus paralicheniformis]BCE05989.1 hypothetical protein RSC1_02146 [Bacillus paralicheniformis]